jgi:hypothetical protein
MAGSGMGVSAGEAAVMKIANDLAAKVSRGFLRLQHNDGGAS